MIAADSIDASLEPADLTVRMAVETFEAMMGGRLDVPSAMSEGQMRIEGPQELFHNLAVFTAPVRFEGA